MSTALSPTARERANAYALGYADTQTAGNNLPQRVAVLTPISSSKAIGFVGYNKPHTVTSMTEFYNLFGICPGFYATRILKPTAGGGLGAIPLDIYPIEEADGALPAVGSIGVAGPADANATHQIIWKGRTTIEGRRTQIVVADEDTPAEIRDKWIAAINANIFAPCTAAVASEGVAVELTSKWTGLTANEIDFTIDVGDEDAGITYSITSPTGAEGAEEITDALNNFGNVWTTKVVNVFGEDYFDDFATANGLPDTTTGGTGRWTAILAKPFVCYTGSTLVSATDLIALAAGRENDLTNTIAPAPASPGYEFEAAANMVAVVAPVWNNAPRASESNRSYPDMPAPFLNTIGETQDWLVRDNLVANGVSTVTYTQSAGYTIQSLIVFRRPGDQPPLAIDWSYVRDLVLDWNVLYNFKIKEALYLLDKTIAKDTDVIKVDGVVKPKDWKAILFGLWEALAFEAIITDVDYAKANTSVSVSGTDPQRMNTTFFYKRTGVVRKASTTSFTGFSFGGE